MDGDREPWDGFLGRLPVEVTAEEAFCRGGRGPMCGKRLANAETHRSSWRTGIYFRKTGRESRDLALVHLQNSWEIRTSECGVRNGPEHKARS